MLFRSNHPAWPTRDCLEGFETLGLDAETEALSLYENAERVFKLGEQGREIRRSARFLAAKQRFIDKHASVVPLVTSTFHLLPR